MREWQNLLHVRRDCKYHVLIIPKYRKRKLYRNLRKGTELVEGRLMTEHIHMCLSIPPKHSISTVGLDEETISKFIRKQEALEQRQGEFKFKI